MPDFLARLIDRASGALPVARPVVPSAFATAALADGPTAFPERTDERSTFEPAEEGKVALDVTPTRPPAPLEIGAAASANAASTVRPAETLATTGAVLRSPPPVAPTSDPATAAPVSAPALPGRRPDLLGQPNQTHVTPAPRSAPTQDAARADVDGPHPTVPQTPSRDGSAMAVASASERRGGARGQGAAQAGGSERGGREEPEAAPVIHVSIGRIEVRAAPAPAPAPRRAASPPPSPALEDYLRASQRGRG